MWTELKHRIAKLNNLHFPGDRPNVFLFSTPRGGSTWLMELVLTQPGFKPANEPFNLRERFVAGELARRGIREWSDLYRNEKEPGIYDYIRGIADGSNGSMNPFFYRNHWRLVTRRVCFKILHAGEDRVSWFRDRFHGRVVLLLRHPLPVALSRKVLPRLQAFLESDYRNRLTPAEIALATEVSRRGTDLEKGVLDWCLQTAVPLRSVAPDWSVVTYEQLVLEPAPVVALLAKRLELPRPERMIRRLQVASSSTHQSDADTRKALGATDGGSERQWLVEKWLGRIPSGEARKAMAILETFELDLYRPDSALPHKRFWIR